jgi:hypothetical protein
MVIGRGVLPNDQAQAQPPETGVVCNDDVQISCLGQNSRAVVVGSSALGRVGLK